MRKRRQPAKELTRSQVIHAVCVTGTLGLLAFAIGVWSLLTVIDQRTRDSNQTIHALADALTQNRAKLVAVGEQPVGRPPEQIVGKQGPPGQDGIPGPEGPPGRDGRDGRDATPAQVAAAVAAYMKAHPVAPGPTGPAGRDGRDGTDGQSPACLTEPDQCRGPTGETGKAGADGAPGADGHPPAAWRWTDLATGTLYACSRDPDSPDSAPAYSCTVLH
jgi:hypothetical protein